MIFDTIAAVATPRGTGGVAVIRVSGESTRSLLRAVFRPSGEHPENRPRHATYGEIVGADGKGIDQVLATYFPAPRSFTGEDVAEISCHGGALITEQVLGCVLAAGARLAQPGEFTRRAVMNGKMKLSSAEALGALLDAKTTGQLTLARGGMKGKLSDALAAHFSGISLVLADAYAKIDFPDEDLNSMTRDQLRAALYEHGQAISRLARTYHTGHAVAQGLRTVICGPVNAGKSTLYNALVGKDAAIVTDVAGTTRDVLTETVAAGQVTLRLFDTAGLRETTDVVEEIGVARTRKAMDEAELILCVLDASALPGEQERALLDTLCKSGTPVIVVLNQCDRADVFPTELLGAFSHVVRLSARDGDVRALIDTIEALYLSDGIDLGEDPIVSNARQYAALCRASEALARSVQALDEGVGLDAALIDAELAMSALGEVDGRAVDEAILSDIFSHFCVGK